MLSALGTIGIDRKVRQSDFTRQPAGRATRRASAHRLLPTLPRAGGRLARQVKERLAGVGATLQRLARVFIVGWSTVSHPEAERTHASAHARQA